MLRSGPDFETVEPLAQHWRMGKDIVPEDGKIEKRVLIQASPSIVYKALTDARDLMRWFCDRATSDPREGGELTAFWKSGTTGIRGRAVFSRLIHVSLVELTWLDEGNGPVEEARHVFRYSIRHSRGTTEVALRDENGTPMEEESLAVLSEGWNYVLQGLKDYCEQKERAGKSRPAEAE